MCGGDVGVQVFFVGIPDAAEIAVGAGAEAGVFLKLPIFQVVPGFPARLGEVGNFVLLIAVLLQKFHGLQVHIRLFLVSRQTGGVLHGKERRPFLYLQAVAAQMLRVQSYGSGEIFHPSLLRLVGQTINEVQRQILNLGLPGSLHRLLHLGKGMDAADGLQFLVAGGLHPQGDPVEAATPQGAESFPIPGGVRVGLQSDLRVTGHLITLFNDL